MKTAVSIPDELFERVERLAEQMAKSRSQLFREAIREYLARHAPDEVTEAMDLVVDDIDEEISDPFVASASRRVLQRSEW